MVHSYFQWMFLVIDRIYEWSNIPPKCPQKLRKCAYPWKNILRKTGNWKCEYPLNHLYKLFSVVHNNFQWMCLIIERIYDDGIPPINVPKNLENLREKENLKMRISTKPFYKLFSVVHNYFLWMFLIIERIYHDRISPKCPRKHRKIARKVIPGNANIY